jgi:organic hydroperoxide reductase OsmC/OhrA
LSGSMEQKKEGKIQELTRSVNLSLGHDLAFLVRFDSPKMASISTDESPESGGSGEGPDASRLLAAAIGNCLSASLAFCIKKNKIELSDLKTDVEVKIARNERGYLRVKQMKVKMHPVFRSPDDANRTQRCKQIFQDYCIVTEAVRKGIPIEVDVV